MSNIIRCKLQFLYVGLHEYFPILAYMTILSLNQFDPFTHTDFCIRSIEYSETFSNGEALPTIKSANSLKASSLSLEITLH